MHVLMLDSKHHVLYIQMLHKLLMPVSQEPLMFLDRMMKASHTMPLKRMMDGPHHYLFEHYKQEALKQNKDLQTFAKGSLKSRLSNDTPISDHEAAGIAAERLKEDRVIANAIGFAVLISVQFSKGDKKLNEPPCLWLIPSQRVRGLLISIWMKNILRKRTGSLNSAVTRRRPMKKSWNISGRHKVMF